ncbi:MAG: hypothetical protein AAFZ80_02530 [Cyanobacteria bacterium P01_A01_bin.105]
MTLLIVLIVSGLVAWALRLMERALASQEFSLMLAGFLVATSAAAMMGVYFLMGDYLFYINHQNGVSSSYAAQPFDPSDIPLEFYATELNRELSPSSRLGSALLSD